VWQRLLLIAQRGDLDFLASPLPGQFAVLDTSRRTKAFFQIPRGAAPNDLALLIAGGFGAPAERVDEFVWVVAHPPHPVRAPLPPDS
jgi:hypothetical protein